MKTNYGERPGMEPLALDGDREYWRGKVAEVQAELDAERASHAETLAALEGMLQAATLLHNHACAGTDYDAAFVEACFIGTCAAIACAKGGRS